MVLAFPNARCPARASLASPAPPTRAGTVGLVALVGRQLGQTLLIGHRHRSAWVAVGGTAAAMAVLVQTPGISQLFGCRPLGPVGWATAIGAATTATAAQLVAPSLPLRLVNLRRGG